MGTTLLNFELRNLAATYLGIFFDIQDWYSHTTGGVWLYGRRDPGHRALVILVLPDVYQEAEGDQGQDGAPAGSHGGAGWSLLRRREAATGVTIVER